MLYIGCPMWGYKAWVGSFFPSRTPASKFLRLYSKQLNSVEGNTTFYALPSEETITRWRQETPETFRFCPKISRTISHASELSESENETRIFVERMRGLGTRLGPIFLQLPPSFAPEHLSQLRTFLAFWPTDVQLAVEVRHPAFFKEPHTQELNALLSQHHCARVLMDTRPLQTGSLQEQRELQARERKPHLPLQVTLTGDIAFVRYIGHPRMEINAPFLDSWAEQLRQWHQQGRTLYVFCHCPYEEHSPEICVELYQRVRKLVPLPELSWQSAKPGTELEQARLF